MKHLIERALEIKRTLGLKRAAGYLRNRGISAEAAVYFLVYRPNISVLL